VDNHAEDMLRQMREEFDATHLTPSEYQEMKEKYQLRRKSVLSNIGYWIFLALVLCGIDYIRIRVGLGLHWLAVVLAVCALVWTSSHTEAQQQYTLEVKQKEWELIAAYKKKHEDIS
jgi:hypothetical protein